MSSEPPSLQVCKERLDEHLLQMLREEPWTTRSLKQVQDPETCSFNERLGEDEMMASLFGVGRGRVRRI